MKKGVAYSHEEKIAILQEHTEHHRTLKEICEEYGISKSYLCYLLKQYRENGKRGIAATKYYSEEFKLGVVKRHYEEGTTIAELVKETGIQYRMIKEWLSRNRKCHQWWLRHGSGRLGACGYHFENGYALGYHGGRFPPRLGPQ